MDKVKITLDTNKDKPKKQGGARPGAGRPPAAPDQITIKGLMAQIKSQSNRDYEELLIEDFLKARDNNDKHLLLKYHQLILNKVMNTLNKIEVISTEEQVQQKENAFKQALEKLITLDSTNRGE